jgi:homoserine acetyltransferase
MKWLYQGTDKCVQEPENLLVLIQTWQNGDVSQQDCMVLAARRHHFARSVLKPADSRVLERTCQFPDTTDVSQQEPYNGDFEKAMASIKAKALVLPSKTDLYTILPGLY